MGRVLIVGWNVSFNYGTNLQAIALLDEVKKRHQVSLLTKCTYIPLKEKIMKIFKHKSFDNLKTFSLWNRIKSYYDSYDQVSCTNKKELNDIIDNYSTILVGSDQLWNPYFLSDSMLLSFLPDTCHKISYGTSVGVGVIPKKAIDKYKKNLSGFDYISVREKNTAIEFSKILNKNVDAVLDPVFFKSEKEWLDFALKEKASKDLEGKYILCYFVGDKDYYLKVKEISNNYNLPIVMIPMKEEHLWKESKVIKDVDLSDFIYLISHADIICTDSFHACCLSLIFKKDFYVFDRFDDMSAKPNIRVENLISIFDLKISDSHAIYDSNNITQLIDEYKKDSLDKLFSHIK